MIELIDYSRLNVNERLDLAYNLMIPSELSILSHDENVDVVIATLKNPYVSFETMLRCSSSPDSRIRSAVAECSYPRILRELANDRCFNVCISVANNKKTPAISLDRLSFDSCWYIRYSVAKNPNTFNQTLSCLMQDENVLVRTAAKEAIEKRIIRVD